MDEELKVRISSDVDNSLKGLLKFANALDELEAATRKVTAQFNILSSATEKLNDSSGKGGKSFKRMSDAASSANTVLINTGRIASDLPFGFIAIQNNLDPLIQSISQLAGQKGALKAFFGQLAGAAGAALAFSILSSALTTLIQKYGDFATAIVAVTGGLSAAEKAQLDYTKAINESQGNITGEIAKINGLISVAKDESISRDQRVKALREVQKEYPGYLKNQTVETLNSNEAAAALDNLTQSLIRKAKIQAAQDLISKETTKVLEAQTKSVVQQASFWSLLGSSIANAGHTQSLINTAISSGIANQSKTISDAEANIKSFQKIINDLLKEEALSGNIGLGKDSTKKIKTAADIIEDLRKELLGLDSAFVAVGGSLKDLSEDKIKSIGDALKELATVGVLPGNKIFDSLKAQIDVLKSTISRPIVAKIPIKIEALPSASNQGTINRVMDGVKDNFQKQLTPFTNSVNEIIRQGTINGIESLSEGIGKALVSGDFNAAVGGFIDAIAGFMSQLGKLLIAQGVALQALDTSLKTFQGIPAIIAGAALVAASAAFRSFARGGTSSFATGGTVFGPTLAMIGDNPGREEHIVPSEVLDKLGGGSGWPEEVTFRIVGTDLIAVANRGGTYQRRINGR